VTYPRKPETLSCRINWWRLSTRLSGLGFEGRRASWWTGSTSSPTPTPRLVWPAGCIRHLTGPLDLRRYSSSDQHSAVRDGAVSGVKYECLLWRHIRHRHDLPTIAARLDYPWGQPPALLSNLRTIRVCYLDDEVVSQVGHEAKGLEIDWLPPIFCHLSRRLDGI